MIKSDELANPGSCLSKAADDEPIFVLRAQDALAALTVRRWVSLAVVQPVVPAGKILEALALAEAMEAWPSRKMPD